MTLLLGESRMGIAEIERVAAGGIAVAFSPAARGRIARAEAIVARYAASDRPVYGLNTGLGGNLGHRVAPEAVRAFQEQIIRGRTIGLGPPLPLEASRAAMFCRLVELALGTTGVSAATADLLLAMLNRNVVPVLPGFGSIGASDIGIMGHLGAVVIGRGEAWFGGRRMPGAAALAAAGLAPAELGPKDGLALISHGAVSSSCAALALGRASPWVEVQMAVLALSMEGYAANPAILDARLAAARPAPGQVEAAERLRALLEGSALHAPGVSRSLQDALCFRLGAPVLGAVLAAMRSAVEGLEIEVNGSTTTPMVLLDAEEILSAPNFHAPAFAFALDGLAIALAHMASGSALRSCKLMTGQLSGLPSYLSPAGGGSAGYVSLQKTAGDLLAEIRLQAVASGTDALAVSDTVEDMAPLTMQGVRKLERALLPLRYLLAIEALAAAQAVDLRGIRPLGDGTGPLHAAIRARVPRLDADREPATDVEAVAEVLDGWAASAGNR